MKKLIALFALAVFALFTASGTAMSTDVEKTGDSGPKPPILLKGTAWTGQGRHVDTMGNANSTGKLTLTFETQDGYCLSGSLSFGAGQFSFSAILNPLHPREINFTAIERTMEGHIYNSGNKRHLVLTGHNSGDGETFMGLLTIQK